MPLSSVQIVETAVALAAVDLFMAPSETAVAKVKARLMEQAEDDRVELERLREEARRLLIVEE